MSSIDVAVMEPKYQQNLGYIARVSKNFGVRKLILVNPRCKHNGKQAIKYSKHASDLLKNARIIKSIRNLHPDLLIGTTGVWHKTNSSYYNLYDPKRLAKLAKIRGSKKRIVLLLGRDDIGLDRKELSLCDVVVFIQGSREYPILNISHALAILLYELTFLDNSKEYSFDSFHADDEHQKRIIKLFDYIVKSKKNIRNKRAVSEAFRRVIRRSMPSKKEINAIAAALSRN